MNKQIETVIGLLKGYIYRNVFEILEIDYLETDYKKNNVLPSDNENWQRFKKQTRLSGYDKHYWLRFSFDTPEEIDGDDLYLSLGTSHETAWDADNPQGLLYVNGEIAQGLDVNHTEYKLEYGKHYDMYVYMYTSCTKYLEEFSFYAKVRSASRAIEKLYYDISVPYNAARCFPEEDYRYVNIISPLIRACNLLDLRNIPDDNFKNSLAVCDEFMENEFYGKLCGKDEIATVNCIGHTHIDVAWLWTYAQTREKVQRSFSTALRLMEQYPEYKFMSSQPQLYKYLKDEAPDVYKQVKERVAEGRWESEGAMWLEADCNLVSGESFVRQILFGKRFIKEEFGKDSHILWLPDVFGYSAALPQILRKSGVDKFFTSKISWNDTNKMPYDTFMWQGIDGSEIFTYFLTAQALPPDGKAVNYADYVGRLEPSWIMGTWNRYQQKDYNNEVLITYGHGDGGGGPTREMLEQHRRLERGLPAFPKARQSHAGEFMARVDKKFEKACKELGVTPKWVGELYLEFHRGTYTSIAKNKKNNRRAEFALGNLEKLSSIGMLSGETYPQIKINSAWETVLLNQFHDVIPGSSIKAVYDDSDKMYGNVFAFASGEILNRLQNAAKCLKTDKGALVFNPNGFKMGGVFEIDGKKYFAENVPAFSFANIALADNKSKVLIDERSIENEIYRMEFDENFNISSLLDKRAGRELVKKNQVINQFKTYEDRSWNYDAWELSDYYKQKPVEINTLTSVEAFQDNVGAGFIITRDFGNSKIIQKIYLYDNDERIDFETTVDWHENHSILKAEFPLEVSMNKAIYEIQFGNIERNTNFNTSWDSAKFEVCGHKWVDISDNSYGVSLLNDCKYGHSCDGDKLTITLLKSSTYPDAESDRMEHKFTYSLLPHSGNYVVGKTVRAAYSLNNPLMAVAVGDNNGDEIPQSIVKTDKNNVIIETVKKAEDRNSIIIRAYDAENMRGSVKFDFGFDVKEAYICDMMENREKELSVIDNSVALPISNFEIVTFEIVF